LWLGFEEGYAMDSKLKILKSLNNLDKSIKKIQSIMKKALTSRPNEYIFSPKEYMARFEEDYKLLYSEINKELEYLEKHNIDDLVHENTFESLEEFYDYYNGKIRTYHERREYISSLYEDLEKQIKEYKIKVKKYTEKIPSVEKFIDYNIYQDILTTINDTGKTFERSPSSFNKKNEEELRDHILSNLQVRHKFSTTSETFNKAGKTDIIIRHEGTTIFIAECKFWDGKKSYLDTISQLLKYLTWRDTKTAVVIFVKNKKISPVLEKVKEYTSDHSNYVKYINRKNKSWYNYIFHITDDDGVKLHLAVLLFHIPND